MKQIPEELRGQMAEARRLDGLFWAKLEDIGYGGESMTGMLQVSSRDVSA